MNNSERVRFINTPLQRGVRRHGVNGTASALLSSRVQTAEAVYVLSAQPALVAQICNLPYRRFVIGRASESSNALGLADLQQNAILRYSRVQICATLIDHPAEAGVLMRRGV